MQALLDGCLLTGYLKQSHPANQTTVNITSKFNILVVDAILSPMPNHNNTTSLFTVHSSLPGSDLYQKNKLINVNSEISISASTQHL